MLTVYNWRKAYLNWHFKTRAKFINILINNVLSLSKKSEKFTDVNVLSNELRKNI